MIEKTLDHQVFEDVFGKVVMKDTTIPPYSTNLECAFRIIKHHQNNGGWAFGVKALHYSDGNLQYRAIYRLDNKISEYTADTIEESICLAGLMISNEQYTEFMKDGIDDSEHDIRTSSIKTTPMQHISIGQEIDVYKIFLNCFKNVKLTVGEDNNNITMTNLLESALDSELITLADMGNILNTITTSLIDELKVHNLIVVEKGNNDEDK